MKRSLFIIFLLGVMVILPLFSQEKLTEEVKIDWWVLPLFAVDKDGNAVLDLENGDINLRVNKQDVTDFTLYKRGFSVETAAAEPAEKEPLPLFKKSRIVFLLFDLAFTTSTNYKQAKEIAKNLVLKSDETTLFSIIAIDPVKGPGFIGGPLTDKRQVVKLIDEKIEWDPLTKNIRIVLETVNGSQVYGTSKGKGEGGGARLDTRDMATLTEIYSSGWRKANMHYYQSFQTLYHALNSIKDNKFIYLFSEGISLFARSVVVHGKEEYWFFMKQTAGYLGQSGAVLFIINPAGAHLNARSIQSGEDSLRYLAKESGGKYMEGEKTAISKKIEKMHRAYYEIAFSDQESFKGKTRHITISSRRKGVDIHTLRNLEKSKPYHEMKNIEKEILVLNLLNPSPLFQSPLKPRPLLIAKESKKKDRTQYEIELPRTFKQKNIDVFKIWLEEGTTDAKVEKESIVTSKGSLKIELQKRGNAVARIVLVNEKINTALVQGIFDARAEKESILSDSGLNFLKKMKHMNQQEILELKRVKDGAADYCMKLSEAVFHYICKETVNEVLEVIRTHKAVREAAYDRNTGTYRPGFRAQDDRRAVERKVTNKYVNDYQLISNKGQVSEQRKLIKGTVKKIAGKDDLLKLDSFITRKISLTSISLLGSESRERFYYRFVKYEKLKGVKTAVIECFPKDTSGIKTNYGKIWVDLADFSIMRLSINPVSIGGYANLLKLARYYKAKLILNCEIDFFKKRNGIRFPTKVLIRETYSGGRELRAIVRKSVWERSKTTYTFDGYQFFDVSATSKEEEMEK